MHLIIDTSTERSMVLFAQDGKLLFCEELPVGFQSSKYLFTSLQRGLEQLKISIQQLSALAVAVGPGLYTGIRVGVAAAKGIAYARKLPLVGFCNLSCFHLPFEGRFLSVIDGRSKGFYTLLQEKKNGEVLELESPSLRSLEELESFELPLVGPFLERVGSKLSYECFANPDAMVSLVYQQKSSLQFGASLSLAYD